MEHSSRLRMADSEKSIRFVDLFAGLGGFHVGLSELGHRCVFASELDPGLRQLYADNFGLAPEGDIRCIDEHEVPDHEMLCAGFPCQPFSRAGKKAGAQCTRSGKLVNEILRIAQVKTPKYLFLENVPDIMYIEEGRFWRYLMGSLSRLGYSMDHQVYTPQDFGIPQKRRRIFIVACRDGLGHFNWPEPTEQTVDLNYIVSNSSGPHRAITEEKEHVLRCWQQFIEVTREFTSLPILAAEFGATYPYHRKLRTVREMSEYRGAFGKSLEDCTTWRSVNALLPSHVMKTNGKASVRLAQAIQHSRTIYSRHKRFLDVWKRALVPLPASWTKLEWQGNRQTPDIWQHIIQFRASGVRIIKPDCAPSLIAMSSTQTPILGHKKRYMSIKEAAALQSLENLRSLPDSVSGAYRALGNAVNARIVREITKKLIN